MVELRAARLTRAAEYAERTRELSSLYAREGAESPQSHFPAWADGLRGDRSTRLGATCTERAGRDRRGHACREPHVGRAARRGARLRRGTRTPRMAATLFLAERTVASHLTRVYPKLGVRSRTELARRLG